MFKEIESDLDPPRFLWGLSRATRPAERYHSCWWSGRKGLARQGHHLHPWRKHWHTYLGCKTTGNAGNADIYISKVSYHGMFNSWIKGNLISCFLKCDLKDPQSMDFSYDFSTKKIECRWPSSVPSIRWHARRGPWQSSTVSASEAASGQAVPQPTGGGVAFPKNPLPTGWNPGRGWNPDFRSHGGTTMTYHPAGVAPWLWKRVWPAVGAPNFHVK